MTQKTKLEIIGPYTPEHAGPFCTRDCTPVELLTRKDRRGNILGYQAASKELTSWCDNGQFDNTRMSNTAYDLMNAREVPAAREFWVNEYKKKEGSVFGFPFSSLEAAIDGNGRRTDYLRTIHVREVLPGEGA